MKDTHNGHSGNSPTTFERLRHYFEQLGFTSVRLHGSEITGSIPRGYSVLRRGSALWLHFHGARPGTGDGGRS